MPDKYRLNTVCGKVFVHPMTKEHYGPIRFPSQDQFSTLEGASFDAIGEDSCGNRFVNHEDGSVLFWDHETDDLIRLAGSVEQFVENCIDPAPIELRPEQVISVRVDPDLAKSIGKKLPKHG